MKNKKGFTLVELLSVIVLLGIIITIGVFSISSVRKSILERQFKNIKTDIELAGEKYYQDTESTSFYVQTLIDEGYLKADNKSMIITDPRDNTSLNCYVVTINNDEDALLGSKNYVENGKCVDANILNYNIEIEITGAEKRNGWYNSDKVKLSAKLNDEDSNYKFIWTTDLNPNTIYSEQEYALKSLLEERGGIIDDTFYVEASSLDSDKVYKSAGERIKIDTIKPEIDNIEILGDSDSWVSQKEVNIKAHDLGSGISEYLFSETNDCTGNYEKLDELHYDVTLNHTFTKDGTYYLCVKDDAGNLGEIYSIVIEKVDGISPKCYYANESNVWKNGTRIISYGCKDEESGCDKIVIGSNEYKCDDGNTCYTLTQDKTYNGTLKTIKINDSTSIGTYKIYDKIGNETTCPTDDKDTLDIYLDNTKPIVTINSMSYSNGNLTINVSLTDSDSGPNIAYATFNNKKSSEIVCNGTCNVELSIGSITAGTVYVYGIDNAGNIGKTSMEIKLESGSKTAEKTSSTKFTQNLNLKGKVLSYSAYATIGEVDCYQTGNCTVTPEKISYSCTTTISPNTTSVSYYDCEDDGSLNRWGVCTASNKVYDNDSGYCYFVNGVGQAHDFSWQCGCSCQYGDRWEEEKVLYCCNDCSQNVDCTYREQAYICTLISQAKNFNTYTGYKGVTATKTCSYNSYTPDTYCSRGYTKNGSICYKCYEGSLSGTVCETTGTCEKYEYSYTYKYYTYK